MLRTLSELGEEVAKAREEGRAEGYAQEVGFAQSEWMRLLGDTPYARRSYIAHIEEIKSRTADKCLAHQPRSRRQGRA